MTENKDKIIKNIFGIVWWVIFALLALLLVNIIGAKLSGKVPQVFGYSVMRIVSGSMEDEIPTGSYILVKDVPAESVEVNSIISFYSDDPSISGFPNTHRVVGIDKTENGIEFTTKGDAVNYQDGTTAKEDKLIGIYVGRLEWLNAFSDFLEKGGIYAIIIIIWVSTFAMMGYTVYKKASPSKTESESKEFNEKEK